MLILRCHINHRFLCQTSHLVTSPQVAVYKKNNGVSAVHTLKKVTRPCSSKKSCYRGKFVQTDMSGTVDQGGGTVKSIVEKMPLLHRPTPTL